jgi:hypothetical protein
MKSFILLAASYRPHFRGFIFLLAGTGTVLAQAAPATPAPANVAPAPAPTAVGAVSGDVEAALLMPAGLQQNKALAAAATNWAKRDPTGALAWLLQSPPDIFPKMVGTVAGACGQTNGKACADLLVQNGTAKAWTVMHPLLVSWGKTDPASATAWCPSTPPLIHYLAFFSVADGYCRKDAPTAAAWAAQVQPPEDRGYAIQGVALLWGRANLDAATPWVKGLPPEDMKTAATTIAKDWHLNKLTDAEKQSALTAQQWLVQLPLSAADQDAILKSPQGPSMYPQNQKPVAKTS